MVNPISSLSKVANCDTILPSMLCPGVGLTGGISGATALKTASGHQKGFPWDARFRRGYYLLFSTKLAVDVDDILCP